MTKIEWTDATWNPITGCTRVSEGCRHCYAERMAARLASQTSPSMVARYGGDSPLATFTDNGPRWSGAVRFHPDVLIKPLGWRKPRRIFVCSMSDLFHEETTSHQIAAVFGAMVVCPQHTFQVLTKRPERAAEWLCPENEALVIQSLRDLVGKDVAFSGQGRTNWLRFRGDSLFPLPNVWFGTSAEDQATADERIPWLLQCQAAVRFVSYEPALGPVTFRWAKWHDYETQAKERRASGADVLTNHLDGLRSIDWIIAGGESGPGWRPAEASWFRAARDQCAETGTAFFMKQMAGKKTIPADLRIREFPA